MVLYTNQIIITSSTCKLLTVHCKVGLIWYLSPFLVPVPLSPPLLLSSNHTGLLSISQTHDSCPHPPAFALLVSTAWCACYSLSHVCMTIFLSFRFQLKCHFYKWPPFLKSFLPCQSLSFASPCLNFYSIDHIPNDLIHLHVFMFMA